MKKKNETEIYGLKETFLEEMAKLNSQFEKSVHFTRTTIHPSQPAAQQLRGSVDSSTLEQTDMNGVDNELQEARGTCSALIIGDSTNSILNQKRMCDTNLQVRLKSLSEDRLESIHNTITGMAEDVDEFICDTNAVVIHAGTNNLSDGDSIEAIIGQYTEIAETIRYINSECKIVISSNLPRKNDKLANQLIAQTNKSIMQLCDSKSYHFFNNTENFHADGSVKTMLYKDNIHLNAQGGKVLGETLVNKLKTVLDIPVHFIHTSNEYEPDFQNGRIPGRSRNNNNGNNRNNNNGNNRKNNNRNSRNNNNGNNIRNNNNGNNIRNNNTATVVSTEQLLNDDSYSSQEDGPQCPHMNTWFGAKGLHITYLNAHYLYPKLDELKLLLSEQNIDIFCLCETFLNSEFSENELIIPGYEFIRKDRQSPGGGLIVYTK